MNESAELAFAAIITINLPNEGSETKLRVRLMPSDPVAVPDGILKPLQDCTLGELSQFADSLEAEILRRYKSSTLVDMTLEGRADITIDYVDDDSGKSVQSELWLEQVVIFPETDQLSQENSSDVRSPSMDEVPKKQPADGIEIAHDYPFNVEDPEIAEDVESLSSASEEAINEAEVDQIAEVEPVVEQEIIEEAKTEEVEPELEVSVAEPELVHEEREGEPIDATEKVPERIERPDVRILGRRRPLDHPTWTAVDILINEPAFRDAQAHSLTSLEREVAGVLVGPPPEKQPDGRYVVHISDIIIAKYTRMHGASVTYTPESWRYVNDKLVEVYPDDEAVIVGWYHTHPGFGIFLSGMDQFIHQNFFTQIWHIALVLDPIAQRSGFFCWDREQTKVDPYEFPWPQWAAGSW